MLTELLPEFRQEILAGPEVEESLQRERHVRVLRSKSDLRTNVRR